MTRQDGQRTAAWKSSSSTRRARVSLEAEYNNRALVPDHMDVMNGWRRDAAAYRSEAPPISLSYGPTERQMVDVFRSASPVHGASLALFIHGGYWQALDGSWFSHCARGLNQSGIDVAVMTYDLSPTVRVGEIILQARQAAAMLLRQFGRTIVPFGHSAGGHLTAALLSTDWQRIDPALPADLTMRGYSISGLFDLVPLIGTSINDKLGLDEAEATQASPLFAPTVAGRTLISTVGELESSEFHRQSRLVTHVWGAHGAHTRSLSEAGKNHFTVLDDLAMPDTAMTQALAELCRG
ncbi:MAG: alpha/beta hydrolase [Beijerinckiaceae bacterium]|nr:alpha/beta hydrolase [Beijerinckiaceae bacterium]